MALLDVNLKDVSASGPPQLPPGVYTLISKNVEYVPKTDTKEAQIKVSFKDANNEGDASVNKVFSLSSKAKPYLKRWLLASKRTDLADAVALDTEDLIGLVCQAVVTETQSINDQTGEHNTYANLDRFIIPDDIKAQMT